MAGKGTPVADNESDALSIEAIDCEALDPQMSLHEMLKAKGRKPTEIASRMTARVTGRRSTADILTGRRGGRIIKAAADHLDDQGQGEEARAFVYSAWCHASFPHKAPASLTEPWNVQTSTVKLTVDPGQDDNGIYVGLPFGAYARLLLIDWSSQAYNNKSPVIDLGNNLGDTLTRLGMKKPGSKARSMLLTQAERLARCRWTFHIKGNSGETGLIKQDIIDEALFKTAPRGGLFVKQIRLANTFFQQLLEHPVAIDPRSINAIRNSPMAIDIYCWLTYRFIAIEHDTPISWTALKAQFGTGYAAMRNFKTQFAESLVLAKGVYSAAKADLNERGIVLCPSPPPVQPAKPYRVRSRPADAQASARLL